MARYIGYFEPYATSHDTLDRDEAMVEEVRNVARAIARAIPEMRAGKLRPPDVGLTARGKSDRCSLSPNASVSAHHCNVAANLAQQVAALPASAQMFEPSLRRHWNLMGHAGVNLAFHGVSSHEPCRQ